METFALISGVLSALVVVALVSIYRHYSRERASFGLPDRREKNAHDVLVFEDNALSEGFLNRLPQVMRVDAAGDPWRLLARVFGALFAGFPEQMPQTNGAYHFDDGQGRSLQLTIERGQAYVTMQSDKGATDELIDSAIYQANSSLVQSIALKDTNAVWVTDHSGTLICANTTYQKIATQAVVRDGGDVFPIPDTYDGSLQSCRVSVKLTDKTQRWFKVRSEPVKEGHVFFAEPIDTLVRAEQVQHDFVQTLTKIFAQLSTGLAVFNRDQQLVLFNPALGDLTGLKPDYLSALPSLFDFLDQLRNKQIMPEPRSYLTWRESFTNLVDAARDGTYFETWNLPTGQIFQVTGRPHPDGDIAILFEDISAEQSAKRHVHSQLAIKDSVIDSMDEAVVVFSKTGDVVLANETCRKLWQADRFKTVFDATQLWQSCCRPNPMWSDLRDFVISLEERAPWDTVIENGEGAPHYFKVDPIAEGATMVTISCLENLQTAAQ